MGEDMSGSELSKKKKPFNPQINFCPIGTPIPEGDIIERFEDWIPPEERDAI